MRTMTSSIIWLLSPIMLLALIASPTPAQCVVEGAGILSARYKEGSKRVFVTLSKTINNNDLNTNGTADKWRLEDISSNPPTLIAIAGVTGDNPTNLAEFNNVTINLNSPLDMSHLYRVSALSLTFKACRPSADDLPTESLLKFRKLVDPATPDKKKNYFPMGKSDGREDSNVYIMTTIEGARGGDPAFAVDLKFEVPFSINPGANNGSGRVIDIAPYFNLKTGSAENGDADAMNFGGKFAIPFNISNEKHPGLHKGLTDVRWDPAAGFESDRRFQNVNLIMNHRLTFGIPGNKHTFKWRIRLLPFIGYELGRNIRSPVDKASDRVLSRPYVGSALYLIFDQPNDRSFSIQVDYIRRFLLKREFSFKEMENEAKDKVLVPVNVGKGPRDYLKTTAEYDFSKFAGFAFSYDYGRLPPLFEKVDHKYSFSLLYKFSTKFTP
ncbi:MAG: hypothetical protein AABO41_21040 [Acidobacteriota bacterium]